MRIGAVYTRGVRALESDSTLYAAAEEMTGGSVSALGVLESGKMVGILSEHDLARAIAEGVDPRSTLVSQFMSRGVIGAGLDDDSTEVAMRMLDHGVRHLPVVQDGEVIGMISARDLLTLEAIAPSARGA